MHEVGEEFDIMTLLDGPPTSVPEELERQMPAAEQFIDSISNLEELIEIIVENGASIEEYKLLLFFLIGHRSTLERAAHPAKIPVRRSKLESHSTKIEVSNDVVDNGDDEFF